jgi:hypothetical protein
MKVDIHVPYDITFDGEDISIWDTEADRGISVSIVQLATELSKNWIQLGDLNGWKQALATMKALNSASSKLGKILKVSLNDL